MFKVVIFFGLISLHFPADAGERKLTGLEIEALFSSAGRESHGSWRVEAGRYCSNWLLQDIWACYFVRHDASASKLS